MEWHACTTLALVAVGFIDPLVAFGTILQDLIQKSRISYWSLRQNASFRLSKR
jgi:hypothetical protein